MDFRKQTRVSADDPLPLSRFRICCGPGLFAGSPVVCPFAAAAPAPVCCLPGRMVQDSAPACPGKEPQLAAVPPSVEKVCDVVGD